MLEQNLASLFRDFSMEIESHRASFQAMEPEAKELNKALDDLVVFLVEQVQILEKYTA